MLPDTDLVVALAQQDSIRFRVAGIVFHITSDVSVDAIHVEEAYRDFVCVDEEPDVIINARYDGLPQIPLRAEDIVFDSEGSWTLYRVGGQHVFALTSPLFGSEPYRVAVFDADFRRGEVYSRATDPPRDRGGIFSNPLEFPLGEVLMVCLLAQERGVMVHACGVDDDGRGYLFAGNSTHGKTTTSRLWQDQAVVLNDDRIVLRRNGAGVHMYGTPWHGAFAGVAARAVHLERVFFLRHAESNAISRRTGAVASSMLLSRSFLPFHSEDGMRFTLDFYGRLVGEVPCYELGFVPDGRVVDFVRCAS